MPDLKVRPTYAHRTWRFGLRTRTGPEGPAYVRALQPSRRRCHQM